MSSLIQLLSEPWAIVPSKLIELQEIYDAHLRGERADFVAIEAAIGKPLDNEPQGYTVDADGIATVPLVGVIAKRANMFMRVSGGASHQLFARDIAAAMADPKVKAILVEIDSPGGSADGTQAAGAALRSVRGVKPVTAWADGTMASAAYWIGAQADRVLSSADTTQMGSIGVVIQHQDVSGAEEKSGRKTTEIYAGKYKRIASAYAPLSDEGRATLQGMVDHLYAVFVGSVADARGVSADKVLADMADGRIFLGDQAVKAGLADGIASREDATGDLRDRVQTASRTSVHFPTRTAAAQLAASLKARDMSKVLVPELAGQPTEAIVSALATEHPQVAAAIRAEGATAERDRIKAVRAQALGGHEALIEQLAFDGKTTGPEAAVAVLNAERALGAKNVNAIRKDAPKPVKSDASADGGSADDAAASGAASGKTDAASSADPMAEAHRMAGLIATKQKEAAARGQTLNPIQAARLVKQEQEAARV